MESRIKHREQAKGFTLIELMVSVALFSIVMSISVGTLLSIIDANRKAQSMRSVTDNLSFALDSMSRTIRTGSSYNCSVSGTSGVSNCNGLGRMALIDDSNTPVVYYFANDLSGVGAIWRTKNGQTQRMTAPEVRITSMRLYVTGASPTDTLQPTVTMVIDGGAGGDPQTDSYFNIQTTATQRLLDI